MKQRCSNCGYRINYHTAVERGLVPPAPEPDRQGMDYCYHYADLVEFDRMAGCTAWVSCAEIDYELSPPP